MLCKPKIATAQQSSYLKANKSGAVWVRKLQEQRSCCSFPDTHTELNQKKNNGAPLIFFSHLNLIKAEILVFTILLAKQSSKDGCVYLVALEL